MKITGLKATPVAVPMDFNESENITTKGPVCVTAVILEVFTDEGYTGIAEVPNVYGNMASKRLVESTEQFIRGRNPADVNVILKELYACYNLYHLHPMAANWAVNSVERALWDINGQKAGLPLYQLWGGAYRKKIPFFAVVNANPDDLDAMTAEANRYYKEGFQVIYSKVGFGPPEQTAAMVEAMRKGIPDPNVKIRVDANQGYNVPDAIRTAKLMEPFGVDCFEQPIMQYNLDGMVTLKNSTGVPILAHEPCWNMYDTLRVIKAGAADMIQLDNRFNIGVTGARISAGMCEAAGIPVASHAYYELGLATVERMHFIASCPACTMVNQIGKRRHYVDDILAGPMLKLENGCIDLPEGPGLGVKLDYEKLEKYNEWYIKNILEAGYENILESPIYGAMYARDYIKDVQP